MSVLPLGAVAPVFALNEPATGRTVALADLAALPVDHMPREVEVAAALTQAELDALAASTLPVSGDWEYTNGTLTLEGECGDIFIISQPPQDTQLITLDGAFNLGSLGEETDTLSLDIANAEFTNPEPGLFVADLGDYVEGIFQVRLEVRVLSPSQIEGAVLFIIQMDEVNCTVPLPFTMVAVSE